MRVRWLHSAIFRGSIVRMKREIRRPLVFRMRSKSSDGDARRESQVESPRILLVDGTAMAYRAHFAFAGKFLQASSGEDTSTIYGFLSSLLMLMEMRPEYMTVVFDAKGKTFRHEMYPEYKANRPSTPEPLIEALPKLRKLLKALSISVIQVSGIEADDVIGTLSVRAREDGFLVDIASPDKDFFQLLRPGIRLLRPSPRGTAPGLVPYGPEEFEQEWDLRPEQFVDMLALCGDPSDNVPGVRGIGSKTAPRLIAQFGSLENLLSNASEVAVKRARTPLMTEDGQLSALLSKKLVTIKTDLNLPVLRQPWSHFLLKQPPDGGYSVMTALDALEMAQASRRLAQLWEDD